jgi:hypothetical protein
MIVDRRIISRVIVRASPERRIISRWIVAVITTVVNETSMVLETLARVGAAMDVRDMDASWMTN